MNKKVVLWISCGILGLALLIAVSLYWFVTRTVDEYEARQQDHIQFAKQHTSLKQVKQVFTYNGDKRYTIVRGKDADGQVVIVWLGRRFVDETFEIEGLRDYMVRQQFKLSKPHATVLRTQYAVYDEQPAWEVYYELLDKNGESGQRGYTYYRFRDGEQLANIQLR
jgi:uncharacterized protein YpmB